MSLTRPTSSRSVLPLQSLAAPVIVIAGGEVTGEYHKPLLTNSVGALLARATSGLLLVLEHRYYASSFPVPDLSGANY
ncbi:putative extracellular serine carboxypeptidase [Beauveria bassiana]|uniref:Putative extracellular serine carboxypeptidase n=1 Tax=Beauveria bassiana TaxID=176275 RepID=A0A2N6NAS4_BEABA|nr:putative extracellular serine carboxypeptidase [Beauveria bassiana]